MREEQDKSQVLRCVAERDDTSISNDILLAILHPVTTHCMKRRFTLSKPFLFTFFTE